MIAGVGRNLAGQPSFTFTQQQPRVSNIRPACALYQPGDELDTIGMPPPGERPQ
jgi:hypothetical protein